MVPNVHVTYEEEVYSHPSLLTLSSQTHLPHSTPELIDWKSISRPKSVVCYSWVRGFHLDLPFRRTYVLSYLALSVSLIRLTGGDPHRIEGYSQSQSCTYMIEHRKEEGKKKEVTMSFCKCTVACRYQGSSTLARHRIHEQYHCVRLARRLGRPFRSAVRVLCTFDSRGTRLTEGRSQCTAVGE